MNTKELGRLVADVQQAVAVAPRCRIWPLTVEELPRAACYGQAFYAETGAHGTFRVDFFVEIWTALITSGAGVILGLYVEEELVGGLAAMVAPDMYDGRATATEFFWYTTPEHRQGTYPIRLIRAYEQWARDKGVAPTDIRMASLAGENEEQLDRLYRKLGYRLLERHYEKEA